MGLEVRCTWGKNKARINEILEEANSQYLDKLMSEGYVISNFLSFDDGVFGGSRTIFPKGYKREMYKVSERVGSFSVGDDQFRDRSGVVPVIRSADGVISWFGVYFDAMDREQIKRSLDFYDDLARMDVTPTIKTLTGEGISDLIRMMEHGQKEVANIGFLLGRLAERNS